eukprot:CAMPEP_0170490020 /NCGR_PEP_ID=MMETSP0208-20121228/8299_1 /TAXON_ID=197538 /ORGANISM="Strombidium inclinatum, Strain S3" /LENGTH=41 /DNA_ID= /DNA_START= /DNA_END= /DNA_ORIENTATION=
MDLNSVNFERAIREIHKPKKEDMLVKLKKKPVTKHGGFEAL